MKIDRPVTKNSRMKAGIYDKYRRILNRPDLKDKEIDEMRQNLSLLARTICEHVWGKMFY
jgi:hypothetical protein